ncbi:MAG: hypothetical protein ACTHOO_09735 [Alcanivorax sp.]
MNKQFLFFAVFAFFIYTAPSSAADAEPVDYGPLESIGLLQSDDTKSLGAGVYHNADRSDLTYLLKHINRSEWTYLQKTLRNYLITAADSTVVNNDIPIESGQDLLTLRLTALLRMGYNKEAFRLYNDASAYPLQEPIIRAGIFSMLLNKEKARACLEVKTSFSQNKNALFWQEANAYCTLSLSHDPIPEYDDVVKSSKKNIMKKVLSDDDFMFEYDTQSFKSLSFFERAILIAEDRILVPNRDVHITKAIPPQHIASLLTQSKINDDTKSLLTVLAVKYGLKAESDLSALYQSIIETDKNAKNSKNDWHRLAYLFNETKVGWLPKDRHSDIVNAFDIASKYDDSALLPFLPAIAKMDIGGGLNLPQAERALKLFLYSEEPAPKDWLEDLVALTTNDDAEENLRLKLLTALSLMTNTKSKSLSAKVTEQVTKYLLSNEKTAALKNIIENIDTTQNNGDKVRYIETNGFDLDWNNSYTMPPYVVLKALDQASKNQNMSVSLLLSGFILAKQNDENIYVGTIDYIVNALNALGLKQQSHHLLAQTVMMMKN